MTTQLIPVPTRDWKVVSGESSAAAPELAIDGDSSTRWHTHAAQGELAPPQALEIDMGRPEMCIRDSPGPGRVHRHGGYHFRIDVQGQFNRCLLYTSSDAPLVHRLYCQVHCRVAKCGRDKR